MQWKCGPIHLRSEVDPNLEKMTLSQIQIPWLVERNKKIQSRTTSEVNSRIFDTSGDVVAALAAFHQKNTVKCGEDKYGCALCPKRFAAVHFVEKHHLLKHAEEVEKVKRAAVVTRMEAAFLAAPHLSRIAQNVFNNTATQLSQITLTPGPSARTGDSFIPLTAEKLRIYDAFLSEASTSEPQHSIYGS